MAAEVGKGFVKIEPDTQGFGAALTKQVQGETAAVAKAGQEVGQAAAAGVGTGIQKSTGSITAGALAASKAIGTGFLAVGGSILAIGGALAHVGDEFDAAFDTIRTGTGATGEALDGLENSFRTVVQAVPASFGDASKAISDLNVRLGLTGKPLEQLAEQFLDLSRITGTDLETNIKSAADAFNAFGVSADQQSSKLDELFRVSQQTGVSVSDLAGQMASGGVKAKEAGLSFEETAALLGLLNKQGLSGSDVFPALAKAMATAAAEGKSAKTVFQETFDAIKNAPSDVAAAQIAVDTFGNRAGPQFAALIRQGKLGYEEFATAIGKGDTITEAARSTDDWRESLTLLKNQVLVALEPAANAAFSGIGNILKTLTPAIHALTPAFAAILQAIAAIPAPVTLAVTAIGGIALVAPKVIGFIDHLTSGIKTLTDVGSKLPGLFASLGTASPILLGIGAAAAAVGAAYLIFKSRGDAVKKNADEVTSSLLATAKGFDAAKISAAGGGEEFRKFSEAIKAQSLKDLTDKLGKNGGALDAFNALGLTVNDLSDAVAGRFNPAVERTGSIMVAYAGRQVLTNETLDELAAKVGLSREEMLKLGPAAETATKFLNDQGAAATYSTEQLVKLAGAGDPVAANILKAQGNFDQLTGSMRANAEAAIANAAAQDQTSESMGGVSASTEKTVVSLSAYEASSIAAGQSTQALVGHAQSFADVWSVASPRLGGASESADALSQRTQELGTALDRAKASADLFSGAIDKVFGVSQTAEQAAEQYEIALDKVDEQLAAVKSGAEGTAKGIDIHTEAGRKNRDVLKELATATVDQAKAMVENGASNEEAGAKIDEARQRLIAQAIQFGATQGEAEAYADQLGLTPKNINSAIALTGLEQEKARLSQWNQSLKNVDPAVQTEIQALIDQGSFNAAEARLNNLSRTRNVRINVQNPSFVIGGGIGGQAAGGDFSAGEFLMTSEKGPELRVEGVSGYTMAADKTQALFANILDRIDSGSGGGGQTIVIEKVYGTVDREFVKMVRAEGYKIDREF